MTETKQRTQQRAKATEQQTADTEQHDSAEDAGIGLRGRVDQMGTLLSKSLDLAEAGLGLGVTLVNRVGAAAQQQILERFISQAASMAGAPAETGEPPMQPRSAEPSAPEAPPPPTEPEGFGITNRLPLMPGGDIRISFSINNDSMEAPKKVALSVEGFVGDAHGRRLSGAGFTIKPARKAIAPMDFEKFVLEGTLPAKAPPDIYRGWVIVASDTELRIPVWLLVSSL